MKRLGMILAVLVFCSWTSTAYSQSSFGDTDDRVVNRDIVFEVKQSLYDLNYDVGRVNGVLDTKTRIAIRKVQRKLDMDVDGRVTRALAEILANTKKPRIWGAIAATTGGSYGSSWNYKTRGEAERRAVAGCRRNASGGRRCGKPIAATRSSCIALSIYNRNGNKGYMSRSRTTLKLALNTAFAACKKNPRSKGSCTIRAYICANGSHK